MNPSPIRMTRQVDSRHYNDDYDSIERFASYYKQVEYLLGCGATKILEIGVGKGLVSCYLKKKGLNVVTTDIDIDLEPEVISALPHLPFSENSFDAVLCAQVLEHLPFEKLDEALAELARVTKDFVVISVPNSSWYIKLFIKFYNKMPSVKIFIPVRRFIGYKLKFDGQHYWELGRKEIPVKALRTKLNKYFEIRDEERLFENPYHHFFLLEVK